MPRSKRSENFYADLNRVSTADFYEPSKKKPRTLPGVFKAERLVTMKDMKQQRKVSFFQVLFGTHGLNFIHRNGF